MDPVCVLLYIGDLFLLVHVSIIGQKKITLCIITITMLLVESRQDDIVCVYYIMWNDSHLDSVRANVSGHSISPHSVHQPAKQTSKPHRIETRP